MNDLIGKTLGSYRIMSQIGVGGMATVYKAYQPGMDRYVAIKILPHYLSQDAQFAKRFQREAHAVARLEHPHILPIYDYGAADDATYIAMRYVEAGTLKQRMTEGPLPLDEIARLIGQIGGALDYAHRSGVIHRDVKPANVLIDREGNTYLTDFGLARMLEASDRLTETGVGLGTPAYMSPEQGQGLPVDHRADLYSLGVILFEMVTGRVPYEADTPMAVMLKHITDPLPLPRAVNPAVPEPIERVILKALAKDPAHRYQTAGEMVQALTTAVPATGAAPQTEEVPIATQSQPLWRQTRGKAMLIGGAVIAAAILALLLSQLPGQVQTIATPLATTAAQPTASKAAVAIAPTQPATSAPASAPMVAPAPTNPCRVLNVDQQEGFLFAQDCDGSNWRKLSDPPVWVQWPSWSPDGQRIVFEYNPSKPGPGSSPSLYIVNADGSSLTPLTTDKGGVYQSSWSPDGTRIAYAACSLFTIHPDGSNPTMLLDKRQLSRAGDAGLCAHAPMWSPDSRRIAFTAFFPEGPSAESYEHRIYLINADGSGLTELLSFQMKDRTPPGTHALWSPDGKRVAFAYEVEGKYKSFLMNADGSGKPEEIESIPDSWSPTHWPQWGQSQAASTALSAQAEQARAFAEPILQAIASRPPDIQDDFSDPKGDWQQTGADGGTSGYLNGEFFVNANPPSSPSTEQCNEVASAMPEMADFVLEIDGRFASPGRADSQLDDWEIQFRKWFTPEKPLYQHDNLHVRRAPELAFFGRCDELKGCRGPGNLDYQGDAIRGGAEWNHIQIVAKGFKIAAYANGEPILYFDDSEYEKDWRAGRFSLVVCNKGNTPLEARWDNLKLWDLSRLPSVEAATSPQAAPSSQAGQALPFPIPTVDPSGRSLYVDTKAGASGDGTQARPFNTIQAAVNAAGYRDTIKVAIGVYPENVVIQGKTLILQGGYLPGAWTMSGKVEGTVIDGGGRDRTVWIRGSDVAIESLTITNGNTHCAPGNEVGGGGGIRVDSGAQAAIQRVVIRDNIATRPCGGGGIETVQATVAIVNSIIANNHANDRGGVNVWSDSQVLLVNSTVTGNQAGGVGACWEQTYSFLLNSIVWNNTEEDVACNVEVSHSLIGVDPLFVDAAHEDYHLKPGSPAIDAGVSANAPVGDIDGDKRPMGAGVDIGADEARVR